MTAAAAIVAVGAREEECRRNKSSSPSSSSCSPPLFSHAQPPSNVWRWRRSRACDGDGGAAVVPLAGARVRPKPRAAPSSGTVVVPWAHTPAWFGLPRGGGLPSHAIAVLFPHDGGAPAVREAPGRSLSSPTFLLGLGYG